MALGATVSAMFTSILFQGIQKALAGVVLGVTIVSMLNRAIANLVYSPDVSGGRMPAIAIGAFLATIVIAIYIPARRVSRINPVTAIREE